MRSTDRIRKLLTKNKYTLPILKGLGMIALVTAISVLSIHYLLGESLTDYANANPDVAYGRPAAESIEEGSDGTDNEKAADAPGTDEASASDIPAGDRGDAVEVSSAAGNSTAESGNSTGDVGNDISDSKNSTDDVKNNTDEGDLTDEVNIEASSGEIPEYNTSVMVHFYDPLADSSGRYTYKDGFYYEPLNDDVRDYITGVSYPGTADMAVNYDDLRYVGLLYVDFNGLTQAGELICNQKIAQDMIEIFYELYTSDYRIDSIYLIDNYGGDDTASMCADNTSCFNYREVEGSSSLSKHAYGLAIDINPFYNPYIVFGAGEGGSDYISPPGSEIYVDRSASFAYKIDENDLCYRLFKSHGFKWGGDWNSCKDYQHFQKTN